MNTSLKFLSLLLFLTTFGIYACQKMQTNAEKDNAINTTTVNEREDDICTIDKGDPVDLDVLVVDGIMCFPNHDSLVNTLDALTKYDVDVINDWEINNNFTSITSSYYNIDELPYSQHSTELAKGRLSQILTHELVDGAQVIRMPKYSLYLGRVLNTEGLVRVGDYIGTISQDLNIWTTMPNKQLLLNALNTKRLLEPEKFIVINDQYFGAEDRDWTAVSTACPLNASFISPTQTRVNPNLNRRIETSYEFNAVTTPANNSLRNYDSKFVLYSTSKKGPNNKYKTDHYHAYNFIAAIFDPAVPVNNWINSGTHYCTKTAVTTRFLNSYRNVTIPFLIANGTSIVLISPGADNSGSTGTSTSHRGMDGLYARFDCN
jgi:hypothetical protein